MGTFLATLAIALASAVCACSSPTSGPSGFGGSTGGSVATGTGGHAGLGGAPGSGGSAPACNQLVDDAPTYSIAFATGAAPTAKGGTIADGTYVISRETIYMTSTLPPTESGRTKVEISGNTWQQVQGILPYDINPDERITSTLSVQGNYLTLTRTCPSAGQPEKIAYSADDSSLSMFFVDKGIASETVFTRQ